MLRLVPIALVTTVISAQFAFEDDGKSLRLTEAGKPVFSYNYGPMWKEGIPEDRKRSGYVHPLYTPGGVVVTDDFPADHYHHRGMGWMWPVVDINGRSHDLWHLRRIRQQFVNFEQKRAAKDRAVIAVENGWFLDNKEKVVKENVEIIAHPAKGMKRQLEVALRFEALVDGIVISGSPEENKGYGGFNIRFAPRKNTVIRTQAGADVPDSDRKPEPWAELAGDFIQGRAGVRIEPDPANPGFPNGWCLRHYGFLGVSFPGRDRYALKKGEPLKMKFRVTIFDEDPATKTSSAAR